MNDADSPKTRKKLNQYTFSEKIKEEFGLTEKYIENQNPVYMDSTDHVNRNKKVCDNFAEINKVMYLEKIKQNTVQGIQNRNRAE